MGGIDQVLLGFLAWLGRESASVAVATVAAVLALIIVSALGKFVTATRTIRVSISQRVLTKACPQCGGSGNRQCLACGGKGETKKTVSKRITCTRCSGSGKLSESCKTCSGTGLVSHALRFQRPPATAVTSWSLIPFGWHQTVTVPVRNLDDKSGTFDLSVSVGAPPKLTKGVRLTLAAGEEKSTRFVFPVGARAVLPINVDVRPETLPFTCPSCLGSKETGLPCPVCGATGTENRTELVVEPCPDCTHTGSITCPGCNGKRRVRRFWSRPSGGS